MEAYMELDKKTTILFSGRLHRGLARLARSRNTSIGNLVREACEAQYGIGRGDRGESALQKLAALRLPVDDVDRMKQELQPRPEELA